VKNQSVLNLISRGHQNLNAKKKDMFNSTYHLLNNRSTAMFLGVELYNDEMPILFNNYKEVLT
jgi:hypothetical protein